jgi:chromosome segregation ATPase
MADVPQNDGGSPVVRNILMVVGLLYVIGSVVFMVQAQNRLGDMEKRQAASEQELLKKMTDSNAQLHASLSVLADKAGMNHKELSKKAAALQEEEKATAERLKTDEDSTKQQFGAVTTEVSGVKGDLGKVGADVADTKNDLATTKTKLEHAIGDLTKHGELIATTHDELELLKHKGDRDYFEFTLKKDKDPTRLSIVSLQLKKTDAKKSKFTLYVMADDKKIEKKDRTINEPLQFYTGRERVLFEVVVNSVDKNTVTGYLSTPKNVATSQMPSHASSSQ